MRVGLFFRFYFYLTWFCIFGVFWWFCCALRRCFGRRCCIGSRCSRRWSWCAIGGCVFCGRLWSVDIIGVVRSRRSRVSRFCRGRFRGLAMEFVGFASATALGGSRRFRRRYVSFFWIGRSSCTSWRFWIAFWRCSGFFGRFLGCVLLRAWRCFRCIAGIFWCGIASSVGFGCVGRRRARRRRASLGWVCCSSSSRLARSSRVVVVVVARAFSTASFRLAWSSWRLFASGSSVSSSSGWCRRNSRLWGRSRCCYEFVGCRSRGFSCRFSSLGVCFGILGWSFGVESVGRGCVVAWGWGLLICGEMVRWVWGV